MQTTMPVIITYAQSACFGRAGALDTTFEVDRSKTVAVEGVTYPCAFAPHEYASLN